MPLLCHSDSLGSMKEIMSREDNTASCGGQKVLRNVVGICRAGRHSAKRETPLLMPGRTPRLITFAFLFVRHTLLLVRTCVPLLVMRRVD